MADDTSRPDDEQPRRRSSDARGGGARGERRGGDRRQGDRGGRSDGPSGQRARGSASSEARGRSQGGRAGRSEASRGERGSSWGRDDRCGGRTSGQRGQQPGRGRSADAGGTRAGTFSGPRPERERPAHNPRDLRAANRADQQRSPDIDADVTGQELDRGTLKEIGGLDERQSGWVAKHLVMAGRYIDEDPALAFQHALAASRKGGRLSRVREAVALTAYAAGEYTEALREFRTYRRMTGDDSHIAAQVDSERALGRLEKALQLASEVDLERLDRTARVELAMVVSGVREDLGDLQGAHDALQIPELDRRRGYPFSPRLFQRQAEVLSALGRQKEAALWRRSVLVAERALGIGGFAEPEIVDVAVEPVDDDERPRGRRERHTAPAAVERGRTPRPDDTARDPAADAPEEETPGEAAVPAADAPSPEDAPAPPAPQDADEVDPNQMALFDEVEAVGGEVASGDRPSEDAPAPEAEGR